MYAKNTPTVLGISHQQIHNDFFRMCSPLSASGTLPLVPRRCVIDGLKSLGVFHFVDGDSGCLVVSEIPSMSDYVRYGYEVTFENYTIYPPKRFLCWSPACLSVPHSTCTRICHSVEKEIAVDLPLFVLPYMPQHLYMPYMPKNLYIYQFVSVLYLLLLYR